MDARERTALTAEEREALPFEIRRIISDMEKHDWTVTVEWLSETHMWAYGRPNFWMNGHTTQASWSFTELKNGKRRWRFVSGKVEKHYFGDKAWKRWKADSPGYFRELLRKVW